jgi:hypothetical protein
MAAAAAMVAAAGCAVPGRAPALSDELVLTNARVRTVAPSPGLPRASALAVRGERIVAVGTEAQVRAAVGPQARVIDLRGATIVPGFIDSHIHLLSLGEKLLRRADGAALMVDLSAARSAGEAARLAAAQARLFSESAWVLGYGWSQEAWPERALPGAALLDEFLPRQLVVLTRSDAHAVWVNSAVLQRAGFGASTPDPPGGRIGRVGRGSTPAGILLERALEPVARLVPRLSAEQKRHAYERAARACVAAGITTVQVAGSLHRVGAVWNPVEEEEDRRILRALVAEQALPLRVAWMALAPGNGAERLLARGPERGALGGYWDEFAIKVFVDGALGSRGAAVLGSYADANGEHGLLRTHGEALVELSRRALARGVQVGAHAIGSRAVREALDAFEKSAGGDAARLRQARFRIEHASAVHPDDLPRFGSLGVIASVQPGFIEPGPDGRTMEERRLGEGAAELIYPFRSLARAQARLCGSTDALAPEVSVLKGIEAAATRGGWRMSERLTAREALALFTREAARAAFLEERVGTIEPGRYADLVVLAVDPTSTAPEGIGEIEVVATMVGGRFVHGEERLPPPRGGGEAKAPGPAGRPEERPAEAQER